MKFDTIIMGGGLAGYACGIKLAEEKKRVLIVSAGQSTLHFSSGSFDLLGYDGNGKETLHPAEGVKFLNEGHPYRKVQDLPGKAKSAKALLERAGLNLKGNEVENHFRLTPLGVLKPTWLTLDGLMTFPSDRQKQIEEVALVNIEGFLDFPIDFLQAGLEKTGIKSACYTITTPELGYVRESPSEMRAANLAKILDQEENLQKVADEINKLEVHENLIILPSILGYANRECAGKLRLKVKYPLRYVLTMPPSVPGGLILSSLSLRFEELGGTIINNNTVIKGVVDGVLKYIETDKLSGTMLEADDFVLSTGSFVSGGLRSNYQKVYEPIFDLDIDAVSERENWHAANFFDKQAYMKFGVKTDDYFHTYKNGKVIDNLYAAGDILSGNDTVTMADKEGIDLLSSLQVAQNILQD